MISIESLHGLNQEQIVDVLLDQGKQPFEIYIPKETSLFNSESSAIAIDYLHLAFAGQRLSEASKEFKYTVVQPQNHESVLFELKVVDLEILAEVLLDISYGYVNDHEDGLYFPEMVSEFEGFIENPEYEVACPEFVDFFREFTEESGE